MGRIEPRTLKGFRDLLPAQALRRQEIVARVERVFRLHGYAPIETPVLEYAEILKGKGGGETDKELFEFTDKGGREVALRFDLTVPLARFVAEHQAEIALPFRRYHLGTVFRGERPQRGRAREFLQCDADLIGAVSPEADAEILVLMAAAYAALEVGPVTLRVNDRRVLAGVLEALGHAGPPGPVLRALDKREKQGDEAVRAELAAAGLAADAATRLLETCRPRGDDEETLAALAEAVGTSEAGRAGVEGLRRVRALFTAAGGPAAAIAIDPSIARGLDYYTGIVLEARLEALPGIGSVGSGGRYDDLAGLYTSARLPGVGCSLGVTRLMDALDELEKDRPRRAGTSEALVAHPEDGRTEAAFAFAAELRREGVAAEVYPEARKHAVQMRYADRLGIPFVFTPEPGGGFHAKRMRDGATSAVADARAALAWIRDSAVLETLQEPAP
jgi:histidyl-tRNA synthetase